MVSSRTCEQSELNESKIVDLGTELVEHTRGVKAEINDKAKLVQAFAKEQANVMQEKIKESSANVINTIHYGQSIIEDYKEAAIKAEAKVKEAQEATTKGTTKAKRAAAGASRKRKSLKTVRDDTFAMFMENMRARDAKHAKEINALKAAMSAKLEEQAQIIKAQGIKLEEQAQQLEAQSEYIKSQAAKIEEQGQEIAQLRKFQDETVRDIQGLTIMTNNLRGISEAIDAINARCNSGSNMGI